MVALKEKPLPLGSLPQFATIIWKECTRGGGVPIVRIDVYYSELFACSTFVTRQRMRRFFCCTRERTQCDGAHARERNVSCIHYGDRRFNSPSNVQIAAHMRGSLSIVRASIAALVAPAHERIDDVHLGSTRVGVVEVAAKPRSDGIDEYRECIATFLNIRRLPGATTGSAGGGCSGGSPALVVSAGGFTGAAAFAVATRLFCASRNRTNSAANCRTFASNSVVS